MSLDKAIKYKKEHRKQYRGAKAIDPYCRNHGGDMWSESDRLIQRKKETDKAESKLKDAQDDELTDNREWMHQLSDDDFAKMLAGSFQVFIQVHRAIGTKEDEPLDEYIKKIKQWLKMKHNKWSENNEKISTH